MNRFALFAAALVVWLVASFEPATASAQSDGSPAAAPAPEAPAEAPSEEPVDPSSGAPPVEAPDDSAPTTGQTAASPEDPVESPPGEPSEAPAGADMPADGSDARETPTDGEPTPSEAAPDPILERAASLRLEAPVGRWFRGHDGSIVNADAAYQLRFELDKPNHWRTLLAEALILAGGTIWYWLDEAHNAVDWDYSSWQQRLTWDAFRYDNNTFQINWIGHPLSGTAFYYLARANDLSVPVSFTYAFMTSWAWEFLLEFQERISINDTIATPMAGLTIGEFLYRLGRYTTSALRPNALHRTLGWFFGFPVSAHRAIEQLEAPEAWSNEQGFGTSIWHSLSLSAGTSYRSNGLVAADIAFEGELVAIPSYMRAGRDHRFFGDADFTQLHFRLGLGAGGSGGQIDAHTLFLGFFDQHLEGSKGNLHGHSLAFGAAAGYLVRSEEYENWQELLALTGLPGPGLELRLAHGATEFRLGARGYPLFGSAYAPSFDAWRLDHPTLRPKSILIKQDYYYGWGVWGRLQADLILPYVHFGLLLNANTLSSHEGLDRNQEVVTADIRVADKRADGLLFARLTPFPHGLFAELRLQGQWRSTWLEGLRERDSFYSGALHVGITH